MGRTVADLEERLTGRALAWAGGVALVLGAIFLISLSFSRGWIGPEGRVAIGLVAGAAAIATGGLLLDRGNRIVGLALTPVGLAIVSISLVGATRLYGLVPTEVGLLGALVSAVAAAVIAVRANSQVVAAFGLVAVLAAPPLVGATPELSTLAFIAVALLGTTLIALWRAWSWLPPIAFVLSAPQAASWFDQDPEPVLALVALAVFWGLHAVASAGQEYRRRRDDINPTTAGLLLANAAFLVWAGLALLTDDREPAQGALLTLVALVHLAIGGFFVVRNGERHLYGLLALGAGVAILALAIAVQFDGPMVPMAWTAEAVALAWVASERRHPYALAAAAILFAAAGLHFVGTEFRPRSAFDDPVPSSTILANVVALGVFLAGLGAAIAAVPVRRIRSWAVAIGLVVTALAIRTELTGIAVIAAWSVLTVVGVAAWRLLRAVPDNQIDWLLDGLVPVSFRPGTLMGPVSDLAVPAAAAVAAGLALLEAIVVELPLKRFGSVTPPAIPFSDEAALAAAILVLAVLAGGIVVGGARARRASLLAAGAVVAYVVPYEVYAPGVAELWSGLAVLAFILAARDRDGRISFLRAGAGTLLGAAVVAAGIVAPPSRLVVGPQRIDHPFLLSDASAALGAVALALLALAWLNRGEWWAQWVEAGAGVAFVYLVSIAVVDVFAGRTGGGLAFEEVQKQGQVALSVLWAGLGVISFVAGLLMGRLDLRQGGLLLLGLSTAKVFIVDLSALDVAYRVISFIALGLLLVGSAWIYGRLRQAAPRGGA